MADTLTVSTDPTPGTAPDLQTPAHEAEAASPFGAPGIQGPSDDALVLDDLPKKKKKKNKDVEPEVDPDDPDSLFRGMGSRRGVETLFKTSYRVNMDLTALADAKANIMISINGIMVSILIASIAPKVDANPWLLVPTSVFLVGCLVSLIFAVLSARPRIQSHVVSLEESRRHHTNLLFFGNFAHLTQPDFLLAMKERMMDPVALYEMMLADIYGVGSVLQRKYALLRASYGAFIVALVLGVAGFIAVFVYAAFFESGPSVVYPIGVDAVTGAPVAIPSAAQPLVP